MNQIKTSSAPFFYMIPAAALLHMLFNLWFGADLIMNIILAGIDLLLILAGWFLYRKPGTLFRTPVEMDHELKEWLAQSSPVFQEKTRQCLVLIGKIRKEFKDESDQAEIRSIIDNIRKIAFNHQMIHKRLSHFGDKKQKEAMQNKITEQLSWLTELYQRLETYSGNLTLMDAKLRELPADQSLKFINDTLETYLKENQT